MNQSPQIVSKGLVTFSIKRKYLDEDVIRMVIMKNGKLQEHFERIVPEDIIKVANELNLEMTKMKATEAILFACNLTTKLNLFDKERLIIWFVKSVQTNSIRD